jgi:hypothetical protein
MVATASRRAVLGACLRQKCDPSLRIVAELFSARLERLTDKVVAKYPEHAFDFAAIAEELARNRARCRL